MVIATDFAVSCESALDPLTSGHYTDGNLSEYPSIIKGFVDKAYTLATTSLYNVNEYALLDCATDNGVATSTTEVMRKFAAIDRDPQAVNAYRGEYMRDY